jgi:hypothetical protein
MSRFAHTLISAVVALAFAISAVVMPAVGAAAVAEAARGAVAPHSHAAAPVIAGTDAATQEHALSSCASHHANGCEADAPSSGGLGDSANCCAMACHIAIGVDAAPVIGASASSRAEIASRHVSMQGDSAATLDRPPRG